MDDGRELPLVKLETTSEIASVLHRHAKERRQPGRPRREVPQQVRHASASRSDACAARHAAKAASAAFFVGAVCRHDARRDAPRPTPALVTQRAAQRLPRLALLLFCAAYVLPGLFGRDPWKSADITAFGYMAGDGRGPHVLAGADGRRPAGRQRAAAALARRRCSSSCCRRGSTRRSPRALPFALLLALTLVLIWYSHLPPRAHRSRAAGAVRLRRRGAARWTTRARWPTARCWR